MGGCSHRQISAAAISSLQRLQLSLNSWQHLPSVVTVTRNVTMSRCHAAVCGPGRWCAATAWPAALRCPRPPALDTRPASTSTSLAAPARFLQIFIQTCVCLHTDNTQLCLRVWSVWCLYGELPLPPCHCLLSLSISRWTRRSGRQWAAAHRKLETILRDICPSPPPPRVPI